MDEARLDCPITGRVDASNVEQDTLVDASQRLDDYLVERPLPFLTWLRYLACERLVETHRRNEEMRRKLHDAERREEPESVSRCHPALDPIRSGRKRGAGSYGVATTAHSFKGVAVFYQCDA
jgi:hypothetical protein